MAPCTYLPCVSTSPSSPSSSLCKDGEVGGAAGAWLRVTPSTSSRSNSSPLLSSELPGSAELPVCICGMVQDPYLRFFRYRYIIPDVALCQCLQESRGTSVFSSTSYL